MKIFLNKEDLENDGDGGLEIVIKGCVGNPTDVPPNNAVIFVERYIGNVLVHIWNGEQDPTTITLREV